MEEESTVQGLQVQILEAADQLAEQTEQAAAEQAAAAAELAVVPVEDLLERHLSEEHHPQQDQLELIQMDQLGFRWPCCCRTINGLLKVQRRGPCSSSEDSPLFL